MWGNSLDGDNEFWLGIPCGPQQQLGVDEQAAEEAFKRFADQSNLAALISRGLSERHFGQGIFFVYRELHRSLHRGSVSSGWRSVRRCNGKEALG